MVLKRHIIILLGLSIVLISCSSTKPTNASFFDPYPINLIKRNNVLIYIAHQDDEVFILPKIIEHKNNNDNVYIIYTCLSYQRGEKYLKKRINESINALSSISIDTNHIFFLGFPDERSYLYVDSLVKKTDSLIKVIKPDIVYTSGYEGGHIDHDIANFVISFLKKYRHFIFSAYEFPEYSAFRTHLIFKLRSFPNNPKTYVKRLSTEEYKQVINFWNYYKSQKFPFGFYMYLTTGKKKALGYLYLRRLPSYDYLKPPPPKKIAYERFLKVKFKDFTNAIETMIPSR